MRIAIDAMGNDKGAAPIIAGVSLFLKSAQASGCTVILVGNKDAIQPLLLEHNLDKTAQIEVVHASQVLGMDDKVSDIRIKRDASIVRAVSLVKDKQADALVALGNTAAAVGSVTLGWRLFPGVHRSGIAVPMPTRQDKPCVVIDMGANTQVKPNHLADYGVMASIYAEKVLSVPSPKVGLLNVGEEQGKGNDVLRQAYDLLQNSGINFIGNVEGGDVFTGVCDVLVCDGFVGNVILKAAEELAATVTDWLRLELQSSLLTKIGAWLSLSAFKRLKQRISYESYGGALLLGVNGICIIGHGKSSPAAVASALKAAKNSIQVDLLNSIQQALAATRPERIEPT